MSQTTLPWYAFDPISQQATAAVNSHVGRALVEIRCAEPYRKGTCGKLLGGVWTTRFGTVVSILHLHDDEREWYEQNYKSAEVRDVLWQEGGFVLEVPILLLADRLWHDIPGRSEDQLVRCPRHDRWTIDNEALEEKINWAIHNGKRTSFQTMRRNP